MRDVRDKKLADLPEENNALYMREYYQPVHGGQRVPHTRWVVLRYPTEIMAYSAGMSTLEFEKFYYRVTTEVDFPMDNTLFDEKIMGSFHFTPGNAYDNCDNGNKSAVHWDLAAIQTPEYGGGEIWIDGKLIRKDGVFQHEAFAALNPDRLI